MILKDDEILKKIFKCHLWKWPVGISLALELKKKIECLIIEAGDEFYSEKAQSRYVGEVYKIFKRSVCSKINQFGGTTGHWGGTKNFG